MTYTSRISHNICNVRDTAATYDLLMLEASSILDSPRSAQHEIDGFLSELMRRFIEKDTVHRQSLAL
jgi:hypothetical protein